MTRLDGSLHPVRVTLEVILLPDADRFGWSLEAKNIETGDLLVLVVNPARHASDLVTELARAVSDTVRACHALMDGEAPPPSLRLED